MRCRRRTAGSTNPLLCFLACLFVLPGARGGPTNRTIDDLLGDPFTFSTPVYAPSDKWSIGQNCLGCGVHKKLNLDLSEIFNGSWHDTTANPGEVKNVTLSFVGTAIWVFCIIPNQAADITTTANFTFELDGALNGTIYHPPDASSTILYNYSVYSVTGLPNVPHTLVMSPTSGAGPDIADNSLMLFDYAIYTFDDTPPSTSGSNSSSGGASIPTTGAPLPIPPPPSQDIPIGAIVGGALGGVAVLLLLGALLVILYRRRTRRARLWEEKLRMEQSRPAMLPPVDAPPPVAFAVDATLTLPPPFSPPPTWVFGAGTGPGPADRKVGARRDSVGAPSGASDAPYIPGGIAPGKHIAYARRELLSRADASGSSSSTNEHGVSTSAVEPSDGDEPRSALLRERVETLQAEVEILRAGYAPPPAYA